MRDYGTVPTQFWLTPEYQSLSTESRLLAVYLLSGPHTNMLGCFRLPVGYIAEDLKWGSETVSKGFHELSKVGFLTRDADTNWVVVHNFLRWNPIENPNQGKSIMKLFEQVPVSTFILSILIQILLAESQFLNDAFLNRLQTLLKPFQNQEQEQNQDQNQDQDQKQEQDLCAEQKTKPIEKTENVENFEVNVLTPTVIAVPLNDKTEFAITQTMIDEWGELYPAVNILQSLRNIRGWNISNAKKRKTRDGVLKHINSWLAKDQNGGGTARASPSFQKSSVQKNNINAAEEWLLNQTQEKVVEGVTINGA